MANSNERQTSNKSGVRSTARKMDNSRHGFAQQPASRRPQGAFANDEKMRGAALHPERGSTRPAKRSALDRMSSRSRSRS
jgi:hypothetical protein